MTLFFSSFNISRVRYFLPINYVFVDRFRQHVVRTWHFCFVLYLNEEEELLIVENNWVFLAGKKKQVFKIAFFSLDIHITRVSYKLTLQMVCNTPTKILTNMYVKQTTRYMRVVEASSAFRVMSNATKLTKLCQVKYEGIYCLCLRVLCPHVDGDVKVTHTILQ